MAQPAGYSNDRPTTTTPSDLGERIENARLVVNGQPPQFGKMSSFVGAKPMRTAFASQEALNSPGLAVSNGPPVAHNYSNPGSLSSHSSRNASPTPTVRYGGVSQSLENLSQSTGVLNNHPPQHRNVTGISRVPQHPPSNEPTVRKTFSPSPVTGTNHPNVHTDSDPGAVGHPHIPGQKNSVEPPKTVSFPFNPHQHSQNLPQNIPSSDNHNENSRIIAGKPPMQHSSVSLSSATRTSQVHTQASFNGPVPTYPQHKNHSTYSSPQSNAPVSSFPNSPSLNTSSNTKPLIPPTSQLGQNPGVIKTGPSHQTPVSPYSGIPPGPGQTPGTLVPQFAGMPSESPAGPSKSNQFPFHPQSASGPSGNNRTAHPGMSLSGASGYNQTPNQQMSYPGMLPASVSQPVYPNMPPSSSGPRQPVPPVYPNMPPSSSVPRQPVPPGYPNMPLNSSGPRQPVPSVYPTIPPNSSGPPVYPSIPPNSSGPRPPGSQPVPPVYPSMPPTSSGPGPSQPSPSSHPSQFTGTPGQGQPPNSYPGYTQPGISPLPSNSASGDHYQSSRRYPQQPGYQMQSQPGIDGLSGQMSNLSVTQAGFNKLWGLEYYDLLQTRNILPPEKVEPPKIALHQEFLDNVNCSPEIFRCTLTKIPESNSLLQKARLPLGILIHPFKDLNHLPVIQCSTIVRCRACRTYINPFVYFVDQKRWKCNLCFRVNELPEEFQYDPVSKTYGDPTRRPEIKSSTMEFIAPSEYMLRPPQPAVYLFILDVSQLAVESGYLQLVCDILLDELDKLPGDGRTQIGFITCDSTIHFYNLAEGLNQPQQMIVVDTDDIFLPCPDNLLVNLAESRDLIRDLLTQLPLRFEVSHDPFSALGAALQAAFKLMSPTGGRVTVFQSCLPTKGPGALTPREDPSQRAGKEAPHLNPAIDFYKRLALDCSGQQVAVDLFVINSQYCDLATIAGVSRFSGGCIHHFPLFKTSNTLQVENFNRVFRRYLTRKIGFEAVMRIRCSRGLAIHTFHGNFFVRSTDLLSLPNVNPDAGFGMQVSIEESLSELQNVCFQAALLYTTSKGERRIRVHTLCLPVATTLPDILYSADQQCIIGLLAKMAVDRSQQTSLSDAREAFINVAIDVLSAYRVVQSIGAAVGLLAPHNLRLLPLYILSLLKYVAFRSGQSTRLDDRVFAMCQMKTLPLANLIQVIYPDMYPVHCLEEQLVALEDGSSLPQPPRLHLSAEKLDQRGVFLMDTGDHMLLYVGRGVSAEYCSDVLGLPSFTQIPEEMYELPALETTRSEHLRNFINYLQSEKPYSATIQIIREDGHHRSKFIERLIEDRTESAFSYYEFLQHLKTNVK